MAEATPEMKPCPFCGGTDLRTGGDDKVVGVACLTCQACGPNHYGRHQWDDRAALAAQPLDDETEQKLREALRFAASRSVMSAEQERRILSALTTPPPAVPVKPEPVEPLLGARVKLTFKNIDGLLRSMGEAADNTTKHYGDYFRDAVTVIEALRDQLVLAKQPPKQDRGGILLLDDLQRHVEDIGDTEIGQDIQCAIDVIRSLTSTPSDDVKQLRQKLLDVSAMNVRADKKIRALEDENFRLAAGQCIHADGTGLVGDEGGSPRCLKADDAACLREENERLNNADAPMACGGDDDPMTAAEEVLAWLLIEKIGVPDDVTYSPNQAQQIIVARIEQAKELDEIDAMLSDDDSESPGLMPEFGKGWSVLAKVEACLHLLERRWDVISALPRLHSRATAAEARVAVLEKALEPFAEAGSAALISGRPPGEHVDANAFIAARNALEGVKG